MAEHGLDGSAPVIGIAFDGTGYGRDARRRPAIWGGEVLVADYGGFERVGPPRRAAAPRRGRRRPQPVPHRRGLPARLWHRARRHARRPPPARRRSCASSPSRSAGDVACVPTTSMGRLFDAVASLLGIRHQVSYEAQAAIELEAAARTRPVRGPAALRRSTTTGVIDPAPVLRRPARAASPRARRPRTRPLLPRRLADAVVARRSGPGRPGGRPVALTGGVFQNALLTRLALRLLGLGLRGA